MITSSYHPENPPTRVVAYLRVSTESQAERGISLQAQRAKVNAYIELHDLELVEVEVDAGASAKTIERPALRRALEALEQGTADALLVVKLDRLTRSVRDLGALLERYFSNGKWSLMSVSESIDTRTAGGRMVVNMLGVVAQWEREVIGERTSHAMLHKAAQGEHTGGIVPFGYQLGPDGKTLVPREEEQQVIRLARRYRDRGLTLRAIADKLNHRGHHPRQAQRFGPVQVRRILGRAA